MSAGAAGMPRLAALLDPIGVDEFFARYRDREHVVVHRGDPKRYADLVDLAGVESFIFETNPRSTELQVLHEGPVDRAGYIYPSGLVDALALSRLYEEGHSIVLPHAHLHLAPLGYLVRGLEDELGCRAQTNLYLSPPGAAAFAPHYDTHDVLVLQIHGDGPVSLLVVECDASGTFRATVKLRDEQPLMRTTLLPGLLNTARRNVGRGADSGQMYEYGQVFRDLASVNAPVAAAGERPAQDVLDAMLTALPRQPEHLAVLLWGEWSKAGWWGPGRAVDWSDPIRLAQAVAATVGVALEVAADQHAPWHPGRCAVLRVDGRVVGQAGELHPDVVTAYGLPARACAADLDLDAVLDAARDVAPAPEVSTYPVAKEDVALVVDDGVTAEALRSALAAGGGDLLESVRLFDVYSGPQVPEGKKSLAFSLRLRAPDRTLTDEDITGVREAALAAAAELGAALRT